MTRKILFLCFCSFSAINSFAQLLSDSIFYDRVYSYVGRFNSTAGLFNFDRLHTFTYVGGNVWGRFYITRGNWKIDGATLVLDYHNSNIPSADLRNEYPLDYKASSRAPYDSIYLHVKVTDKDGNGKPSGIFFDDRYGTRTGEITIVVAAAEVEGKENFTILENGPIANGFVRRFFPYNIQLLKGYNVHDITVRQSEYFNPPLVQVDSGSRQYFESYDRSNDTIKIRNIGFSIRGGLVPIKSADFIKSYFDRIKIQYPVLVYSLDKLLPEFIRNIESTN